MALTGSDKSAMKSCTFAHSNQTTTAFLWHVARVFRRPPTKDAREQRKHRASDFLLPPSHGLHGGETTVSRTRHVPVRRAMVHRS